MLLRIYSVGVFSLLLLSSCGKSQAQKSVDFASACERAAFSVPQCALLSQMFEAIQNADSDATSGIILGAASYGYSMGSSGK